MTVRRRIVTWDEQDGYARWRRVLAYVQRPGVRKGIKRRTHRRERREAKTEISEREALE